MQKQKLKIGILINNLLVPAWIYEMLVQIVQSSFAEITVVIKNSANHQTKNKTMFSLYDLYRKFENKIIKTNPDALAPKDISFLVKNVPVINIRSLENTNSFEKGDVETIRNYHLDVCLKLGFRNLEGEILDCAKYGVWAYQFSNTDKANNIVSGVWEVINNSPVTGSALQVLNKEDGRDIYRSWGATNISIKRSLNLTYWKAASFVPRKLKELYEKDIEIRTIEIKTAAPQTVPSVYPKYTHPGNIEFAGYLIRHYFNKLTLKFDHYFSFQQWRLLYTFNTTGSLKGDIYSYKSIIPPKDRFWADPHVFTQNGQQYFIFIEEYIYAAKKAHISVMELDKNGNVSAPKTVLNTPYHLSYPFVFKDRNEVYMIPETSANKTIEIYKCTSFPYKWEFQMNLMENLHAVDTTIHYHNNKYWLFTNIKENKGASAWDELFIFYSEDLLTGHWMPHTKNPVISDVRVARPAGNLFIHNEKLYRPSQDCSVTYGYATNINEVLVLNENEYEEIAIEKILPDWGKNIVATHTYSRCEELSVIDVRVKIKK